MSGLGVFFGGGFLEDGILLLGGVGLGWIDGCGRLGVVGFDGLFWGGFFEFGMFGNFKGGWLLGGVFCGGLFWFGKLVLGFGGDCFGLLGIVEFGLGFIDLGFGGISWLGGFLGVDWLFGF